MQNYENKIMRKIAFLLPVFFLCLGLDSCKSPEEPEGYFKYRYEVEVIYSGAAEGGGDVTLYYILYDPVASGSGIVPGYIKMNKFGGNKAYCYLPKVYVQHEDDLIKHKVSVVDENVAFNLHTGENIEIQGAYELEIESVSNGTRLTFKMSKE